MDFLWGWSAYRIEWVWIGIWLWLLIYWLELLLSGRLAGQMMTESVVFRVMRFGSWRRWWRHVMARQFLLATIYTFLLYVLSRIYTDSEPTVSLTAICLLGINLCLGNFFQCLLLLRTGSVRLTAGVMALSLAVLFALPPALAAWYPVSWGMWRRSRLAWGYGFAVLPVLFIEIMVLTVIFLFGEKVRRH